MKDTVSRGVSGVTVCNRINPITGPRYYVTQPRWDMIVLFRFSHLITQLLALSLFVRSTLIDETIGSLDEEFPHQYSVQCEMGGSVTMDEATLLNSPYLKNAVQSDSTVSTITILGNACTQETLDMVTDPLIYI
jgi:hypothetical protein